MKIFRPIWAEIDCDRVERNLRVVRDMVGNGVKIMGVVKADAYGHGAVPVSKSLLHAGADSLAVASLEEAVELRQAGIGADILILGYTQPGWASAVVEGGFSQTVYHLNLARALSHEAGKQRRRVPVHIKIDTGMRRIGLEPEKAIHFIKETASLDGLKLKGIYTHFSMADDDGDEYSDYQLRRFNELVSLLKSEGIDVPFLHTANSAAVLRYPETHFDMVRPGILLYGLSPSKFLKERTADFKPVMTVKTTIVEMKTIEPGSRVSYSGTFRAERKSRIATLPAGYADGFSRKLSNCGSVLVGGRKAPIVGNVCMDFMMVDVTDLPGAKVGDEVILIGRQGDMEIHMDDIADHLGTINYEVASLIGKRVTRVFINYLAGSPNEV
ncbi:MAG TPA: alanine racemase [bacterium]|nr:alanine racemase [bacterium]